MGNKSFSNSQRKSSHRTSNSDNLPRVQCYKCEQFGHKAFICPYSMNEIREMKKSTQVNINTNSNNETPRRRITPNKQTKTKVPNLININTPISYPEHLNGNREIVAAVTKKNRKSDKQNFTQYKPPPKRLQDDPVPIATSAMKHNENDNRNVISSSNSNNIGINMTESTKDSLLGTPSENNYDKENDESIPMIETPNKNEIKENNKTNEEELHEKEMDVEPTSSHTPMNDGSNNLKVNNNTDVLRHFDIYFINQPNINNAKKMNKIERIKEINKVVNELAKDSNTIESSEAKNEKIEKHIRVLEELEKIGIEELIKDVVSTEVKTKLDYLLDWFPKFRNEFIKSLKLTTFENSTLNIMSLFSHNKIIKVGGYVERNQTDIFLDTCSSVNLITASALKKFNITKPPIGTINEIFLQAFSNSNSNSKIFELSIKIGDLEFIDYFRLVEKDDIFDFLIGVDSLKRNRFLLNLVDDSLSYRFLFCF
ncbi:hypothetical protein PIROE2DRAFT_56710 [Piromyces sp. E2]|nr:hypothetical protein PIROE2DRAFT_56710 [Piromyces sp. E2]|eukprot:OUM70673.1 hypothetical protein PIROE2DRAFT_56710 [Piromyces sp. E2]